jgi:hypothetical protein
MEVANTLAYYNTATIIAVKSFIGQAPGHQVICLYILRFLGDFLCDGT